MKMQVLTVLFLCPTGAWETKVSNREKRQQRRKDKGPEDSGSSGGVEAPKVTKTPVNTKKNKGNQGMNLDTDADYVLVTTVKSWHHPLDLIGFHYTSLNKESLMVRGFSF